MADRILKYLLKVSPKDYIKINLTIALIKTLKFESLDILKMKGFENKYRVRVGNHRILFSIVDGLSFIEDIKKRDENTY